MHTVNQFQAPSEEEIRCALQHIDSNVPRDEWAQIAMAIKSELGDAGFSLFDDWSQGGSTYNKTSTRSTWRSIKAVGIGSSITISTLFKKARQQGWAPDTSEVSSEHQAVLHARAKEREARRKADEQEELRKSAAWRDVYSGFFEQMFNGYLADTGTSPYLDSKQCGAYGLGFPTSNFILITDCERLEVKVLTNTRDFFVSDVAKDRDRYSYRHIKKGAVFVPLRDIAGKIHNAQIIFPSGKKSFPRNAPKSGLFHLIGDMAKSSHICIAEGYATAATIHRATGFATEAAIDLHNMRPVLKAFIDSGIPQERIILCGDDDIKTKNNPGRTKTQSLATDYGCKVVFPSFGAKQQ